MRDLLGRFAAPAGHYNELHDRPGELRRDWQAFAAAAGRTGPEDLAALQRRVARTLHDNGVTYTLQTASHQVRAWALDVLPHIVSADEWGPLAAALRQRARLLEQILADLYGPQRLLEQHLPPALVFGHRGFLRAAHGVTPPGGTRLHLLAFDVGRGPDGAWRVLATRAQAPSGAGYALENRLTVSRLFPDAFRDQRVHRLAPFFRALQESLLALAPADAGETPHVVLLTPGRYNETYFEHAYLSRYLGFTLVEGADLTVRDDRVYLKTVGGLRRVHVVLRRVDDDFCDPLELRAESALGVPGLLQAWRRGQVCVANAFGTGAIESPGLTPYLPAICETLLGEPLAIASPAARWCAGDLRAPLIPEHLASLVIKPVMEAAPAVPIFGAQLGADERRAWIDRIARWPERFVLEEYLPLSHVPVWTDGGLESRALMLRVFLAADGAGDFHVLPGGLSRVGGTDREVVSGQRGGGSKDTWVLSDAPVERFSLLPGRLRAHDLVRTARAVSSRSAEHLFWMGRYAERAENAARLLRAVLARLPQDEASVAASSAPVAAACRRLELLPADLDLDTATAADYERALIAGITGAGAVAGAGTAANGNGTHSLGYNIAATVRVAGAVRDRLSSDNWRILNGLGERLAGRAADTLTLADALELLDDAIVSLVAVGGLEMAHMTRDDGWRFMSLGRHLERVIYVLVTTGEVARSEMVEDPALLEWLLDLSDSLITYRARYMGQAEWVAVADLLLFDRHNPRSAAFQLAKLAKHVPQLPGGGLDEIAQHLESSVAAAQSCSDPAGIAEYLDATADLASQLSDLLTLRYFSHVYEPAHATLL